MSLLTFQPLSPGSIRGIPKKLKFMLTVFNNVAALDKWP
jgi:hypothetical protein